MTHCKTMRANPGLASLTGLVLFLGLGTAHAAVNWTGNAGNFYVNDTANWSGSVWNQALCIMGSQPAQRLTIRPANSSFFGGAELDYSGALAIRNLSRDEKNIAVASIRVDEPAKIKRLTVRDCKVINRMDRPLPFLDMRGMVEMATVENNMFVADPGENTQTTMRQGK